MLYKRYLIGLLGIYAVMALSACNKYLDIAPKGFTTLTTVTNYDQWLNDANKLGASATTELNQLGDNVDNVNIILPATSSSNLVYLWAAQFTTDVKISPVFWGAHYANINSYNTVLEGVDKATDGTEAMKRSLKAEALLGRAFEYFYLINLYGKPYDAATAATDLGVPFVTSNDVSQKVPPRSTVKEVYDRMIADINAALPDLPKDNSKNRMRGSVQAAYSVLARIYLTMRNYTEASKNAQLALQTAVPNTLTMIDYRIAIPVSIVSLSIRPDAIYARRLLGYEIPELAFMKTFDSKDLRLKVFYSGARTTRGTFTYGTLFTGNSGLSNTNTGTSLQEMKLIIAEAAARAGDVNTALGHLNDIRMMRFNTADYQPLQSTDKDQILAWVFRERSFELPYAGLRWFDMRRLDKENRMPVVNRYNAQNSVIATLPQQAAAYTLQIPNAVLLFNPEMPQN